MMMMMTVPCFDDAQTQTTSVLNFSCAFLDSPVHPPLHRKEAFLYRFGSALWMEDSC